MENFLNNSDLLLERREGLGHTPLCSGFASSFELRITFGGIQRTIYDTRDAIGVNHRQGKYLNPCTLSPAPIAGFKVGKL